MTDAKREKKMKILEKLNYWHPKRCEICEVSRTDRIQVDCKCKAAQEIRKLGNALNLTVKTTMEEKINRAFYQAENCWNLENFILLKELEVTDKEIGQRVGMSIKELADWRRAVGLPVHKKSGRRKEKKQ